MNLLVSSGEASGDIYGSRLVRALAQRRPEMRFFGMGGPRLEQAGLERIVASEGLSVVGIFEVFDKIPRFLRALRAL
ncbi:MAG TPA: lipid-A-disaccharide synthase, partial [Thermoanaerobaculia bacterium]